MAITKPTRSMLSTGISDSSDATFLTADSSENATFAGNLTVTGNLTVSGTQTVVSSSTQTIADPLIELNTGAGSNANDLGFVFERGSTGDNACLIWDESADSFAVGTTTATGTSTGNMTFTTGDFTAGKIIVDDITIDGSTISDAGHFTIDSGNYIYLDADGGNIVFQDAGTSIGTLSNQSSNFNLVANVQDKDIIFKGNDGGSTITALTLDMSDAGTATFNHDVKLGSSGRIGIGIAPVEMLDIQSASGDARIRLDAPASSDTEIKFFNDGTAQYTVGHDDATDNFVIGGANVDAPLVSVNKSGAITTASHVIIPATSRLYLDGSGDTFIEETAANIMTFTTGNSERLRIGSSGNLELGYSGAARQQADSQAFSIITPASGGGQGIAMKRLDSNNDQTLGEISWSNNTQDGLATIICKTEDATNSADIIFKVNNAGTEKTAMWFDGSADGAATFQGDNTCQFNLFADSSSSNIGQTNITFLTDGSSAAHSVAEIRMQQPTGDEAARKGEILFRVSDNGGPGTAMSILNNGNVKIGATAGSQKLEVLGQVVSYQDGDHHIALRATDSIQWQQFSSDNEFKFLHIDTYPNSGANTVMTVATNREMSGNFNDTSDRNLKTNIIDLADNQGLDVINRLRPRRFDWKSGERYEGNNKAGFIAQEVQEVIPNAVSGEEYKEKTDAGMSVNVTDIVAHLTKAVQQLSQEKADREQEITNLEKRIEQIEQRLI